MARASSENASPPIACSLDASDQRSRLREWAELLAHAVTRKETRTGVHYSFVGDHALEERIRVLAAAERACCPFLELTVSRAGERIALDVAAPAGLGRDALRSVFAA
jgi:hypothetical protein